MSRRGCSRVWSRRVLLFLCLVFLLGAPAAVQAHGDGSFPRTANHDWRADIDVERDSRYDVLITGTHTFDSKLDSLRLLNPSITRLLALSWYVPYYAGTTWEVDNPHFGWTRRYFDLINENDWWLTGVDSSGTRYKAGVWYEWWTGNFSSKCPRNAQGQRLCDVFADFLIDHLISQKSIEGLFFDNCWDGPVHLHWQMWGACPSGTNCADPSVPRTPETEFYVGFDMDEDGVADPMDSLKVWWSEGVSIVMNRLRERLGPSFYLVGNGRHHYSMMNGAMYERYPRVHGALDPDPNYGRYRWLASTFSPTIGYLGFSELFYSEPRMNIIDVERGGIDQYTPQRDAFNERLKRWTLGSTVLGDGYFASHALQYHDMWWEPEFDLRLGFPLGPAYSVEIQGTTIWRRDFTNGEVWVNGSGVAIVATEDNPGLSGRDGAIFQSTVDVPYPFPNGRGSGPRIESAGPNPTLSSSTVRFRAPSGAETSLRIFDVAGRLVQEVWSGVGTGEVQAATWDGAHRLGFEAPAGIYFAVLSSQGQNAQTRLVRIR